MGFIGQLAEKRDSLEEILLKDPAKLLIGVANSEAGVTVNERTALACSAVFACVQILADTVASLPLFVYERMSGGGRRKATGHPLFSLLHDEWNEEMSSFTARETMQAHLVTWGNSYAFLDWNGAGRLNGIWPLRPDRMEVKRDPGSGEIVYRYQMDSGQFKNFSPREILHVRGLGFDGLKGYSVIRMAKDAIGLAIATEQAGSKLFANGIRLSGVIEHPKQMGDTAMKNVRASLDAHAGSKQFLKTLVLEEGMKWKQTGIPPEDAQFIESRKFSVVEVARFFRMPPHKIQSMDAATFGNIEHQAIEFVVDTIRPWLVRTEQEYRRKLLRPAERSTIYIEHLVDGLLRGDIASRYAAYAIGRGNTWLSGNDVRDLENMNPIGPQGDVYHVPMNWVPADVAGGGDPDPEDVARARRSLPEFAERRSVAERKRAQRSHLGIFRDAAGRLVQREVKAVRKVIAGNRTRQETEDLVRWLEEFYRGFGDTVAEAMLPAVRSLGEQINAIASEEVGEATEEISPELERFFGDYAAAIGSRHAASSQGQLLAIVRGHAEIDAAIEALDARLDEWTEKRPEKIAQRETVQVGVAVAKVAWVALGVTLLGWVASGDACPICQELDGKVVGVEQNFVNEGDTVNPGGTAPLRPRLSVGHPPLHEGCNCNIAPG